MRTVTVNCDKYSDTCSVWLPGLENTFLNLWVCLKKASNIYPSKNEFDGDRIKLVTVGQPRTDDVEFAKAHGKQVRHKIQQRFA
ncbi:unnamed protein product [Angiostrongylus costaricensis]|uniref:Fungal lipase-type domain-containing protein n=1 Tax=Angiostrongylus costaricensis TaxID=334426 RepID=A0A3P7IAS5_ANGCS|nr:unnamed protein product [Angiostrongylus costaricensis]